MPIDYQDTDSFRRILIDGRLDSLGSDEISMKFAALVSGVGRKVVVDLSGVSFLSSIGIRLIVQNAKALSAKNGTMVLYVGENEQVDSTLEATGINALVQIFTVLDDAEKAAIAA